MENSPIWSVMGVISPSGSFEKSLKEKNSSWSWNGLDENFSLFEFDKGEFRCFVESFLWIMVSFYGSSACFGAQTFKGENSIMGRWGKCGIWSVYFSPLQLHYVMNCFLSNSEAISWLQIHHFYLCSLSGLLML